LPRAQHAQRTRAMGRLRCAKPFHHHRERFVPADEAGYGQERFVPPYVRSRPDSSEP